MSNTKNLLESVQNNLNEGSALRVFKPESEEYTRLQNFADELNNDARFQANYTVEDLYFDYGQNWMWTTIIAHKENERGGGWQALTPRNQERVVQWTELDDVKQELLNNEEKLIGKRVTESDENFYNYVKGLLDNGSIDDPDYYNKLSDKEKEDLIRNTWMKDKDIINDYNNLNEAEDNFSYTYGPEEIIDTLISETGWSYEDMGYDSEEEYIEYIKRSVDGIKEIQSEEELSNITGMGVKFPGFRTGKVKTILNDGRVFISNNEEGKLGLINAVELTVAEEVNKITEAETSLIKTYNETDGGYKNNATSVYGELVDGNYYDFIPDCEYLGIFNAPVEEIIHHVYNTLDEDDTTFEEFAAKHEITNYENREALLAELNK